MSEFNELLEKVEAMPLDSQEVFADILIKNISENKKMQIRNDIIQGRKEYQSGKTHSGDVKELKEDFFETVIIDPINEVVEDFRNTNLYSKEFLQDLEDGLRKSSYLRRD